LFVKGAEAPSADAINGKAADLKNLTAFITGTP
jgi:hypothetical protein